MFGKLLKYDFRSMFKQFAFVWPAALVLAFINRFTLSGLDSTSAVGETTAGIAMFAYVGIMIAMFVVAVIFTIQRFYKGLLGDEGYLMHTLPVRPWQLIGSKLLTAVVTTVLSILVALLSIFLIVSQRPGADIADFFRLFWNIFRAWNIDTHAAANATHAILWIIEFLLFILVGMAAGYLHIYLSMAIGHLFNKRRVMISVVAYIGIDVALSVLLSIMGNTGVLSQFGDWVNSVGHDLSIRNGGSAGWGGFHLIIWTLIASQLLPCAIYYAGTEHILRKRLNLE